MWKSFPSENDPQMMGSSHHTWIFQKSDLGKNSGSTNLVVVQVPISFGVLQISQMLCIEVGWSGQQRPKPHVGGWWHCFTLEDGDKDQPILRNSRKKQDEAQKWCQLIGCVLFCFLQRFITDWMIREPFPRPVSIGFPPISPIWLVQPSTNQTWHWKIPCFHILYAENCGFPA